MPQQWFQSWFGSPYYHLLYSNRDNAEAVHFIDNLVGYLNPPQHAAILDIACGRGRHAVCLNKRGYDVTGIDLAIENIRYARRVENPGLQFFVHDMRALYYSRHFDIALNLFTSFGYFDTDEEHIAALQMFNKALKPGGILVLDYFNSHKVVSSLVAETTKTVKGIHFHLQKKLAGNKIIKTIKFEDGNKPFEFMEVVSTFTQADFMRFFELSGFTVVDCFGNYNLDKFDADSSDRLIFICRKTDA